jgi:hypothetical protein
LLSRLLFFVPENVEIVRDLPTQPEAGVKVIPRRTPADSRPPAKPRRSQ